MSKQFPSIACCGLDCGLCPNFHSSGPSRCPGCAGPDFASKHPSCSLITCCVKKHHLEVCAQCPEFPCEKIAPRLVESTVDSMLTYKKLRHNMTFIKEQGLPKFLEQQQQRIALLERMLSGYNDDRSKSFYCLAATLLPIDTVVAALNEADKRIKADGIKPADLKGRAKILHDWLNAEASKKGIELKLRKGKK
jgi:hypothetical protein